jgi:hypothetical protein
MRAIAIFTFSIFLGMSSLFGQSTDSSKTTYSQEDSTITTSELKRFYRYITRANVEEKTLFKLGFWPNTGDQQYTSRPTFRIGIKTEASVERKITPSFSIFGGFDFSLQYNVFNRAGVPYHGIGNSTFIDIDKTLHTSLNAKLGTRYYYAMAKRMRTGKSANNFSGNYLGLQLAATISARSVTHYYDSKTGETLLSEVSKLIMYDGPLFSAMWGVQRRLGKLGFVDINVGPELTLPRRPPSSYYTVGPNPFEIYKNNYRPSVSFRVNAVIGLGW